MPWSAVSPSRCQKSRPHAAPCPQPPLRGHHSEWVFTYQAKRTRKYDGGNQYIGTTRERGKRYPLTYRGVKSQSKRIRRASGVVDFRFHDIRHDVGTRLLRKTGNLKTVQKALNHADLKSAARYAHVLDEEVAADMEALQNQTIGSRTNSRTDKLKTR
ncbi:MAG: tyrosine-type recombinase/integrase [Rhizobiaceae bacterium]|nr:tyrosine-type recombinase/integrase [Rhizobiaceae bacterium]